MEAARQSSSHAILQVPDFIGNKWLGVAPTHDFAAETILPVMGMAHSALAPAAPFGPKAKHPVPHWSFVDSMDP